MITIQGPPDTDEHRQAQRLRDLIVSAWPGIVEAQWDTVQIVTSVKCYGQKVVDIDMVVFVHCAEWGDYPVQAINPEHRPLYAQSLCLVIELKGHQPDRIYFEGTDLYVRYRDKSHAASQQSFDQQVSLRNYLSANGITPPYVVNLIWLYNTPEHLIPTNISNIFGADATWDTVLQRVQQNSQPWRDNRQHAWLLRAAGKHYNDQSILQAGDLLTRKLEPSPLDRAKMETITRRVLAEQQYADKMGEQLLIFRGRGGTGKTVRLLQLANQLYQERGDRVLILSYNIALVSDLRRLLHIMDITEGVAERSIVVRTVHSFMGYLLSVLGTIDETIDFYEHYDTFKANALDMIDSASRHELQAFLDDRPDILDWDYVLIDEAQDWPTDERDILYHLYGHTRFVLADGVDQFVRGDQKTNWRERVPRRESQIVTLQKSLRLKSGLATFAQAVAQQLGLKEWQVDPNTDVYGGHIIIIQGDYDHALHTELLTRHQATGNQPIDMLFCIPPTLMVHPAQHGAGLSTIGEHLTSWGYQVWDGTARDVRHAYPLTLDAFRIVQYDSCRGLEGWTVVNLALDALYDHKQQHYEPFDPREMFFDPHVEAHRYAARWLMIPLTRAIDTLVIQVNAADHPVTEALRAATAACQDMMTVEWRTDA
jgi:hypothetical protein